MPNNKTTAIERPEIVIGVTFAAGTPYKPTLSLLEGYLKGCGYAVNDVRFSDYFESISSLRVKIRRDSEFRRIDTLMRAGDEIRRKTKNDGASLLGVLNLFSLHNANKGSSPGYAHVLHSFKHPEEVLTFRRIYGQGFFLIGIYASRESRKLNLMSKGVTPTQAEELLNRDALETQAHGQRLSETFHLSDYFLRADRPRDLYRFLDLLFGNPFDTPTADEYGMFLANSAALRSADLSRQVGAMLLSSGREVLGVGANEVPRFGGGQYWAEDSDDHRDFVLGFDPNTRERRDLFSRVLAEIRSLRQNSNARTRAYYRAIENLLKDGNQLDITEFGRVVHAEMEAIVSCARKGLSPVGSTMYTTTFPCHVCAKHIVAAGICDVAFIEPYPKSKALQLHPDSIVMDEGPSNSNQRKVRFRPFLGVSPRRYVDLFSMNSSSGYKFKRKDKKGNKIAWVNGGQPRIPVKTSYFELEAMALDPVRAII